MTDEDAAAFEVLHLSRNMGRSALVIIIFRCIEGTFRVTIDSLGDWNSGLYTEDRTSRVGDQTDANVLIRKYNLLLLARMHT